ncbi:MAG: CYTH and CHAD domain-containing protein [Acidimicrobiales bacterium]
MRPVLSGSVETEAKLDAWVGFALPDLQGVVDGAVAVALPEKILDATYYDTADLRLARAGITVRHRLGEGDRDGTWTVKLPEGSTGPATSRREITLAAPGRVIPDEVAGLVRAVVRSALLAPVARLRTRRRATELRDGEGRPLAEVDDDEVSVMDGPRLAARFRELEVELHDTPPPALLERVVERLRAAGASPAGPAPKLMKALGPRSQGPADTAVATLGDDATTAEVVRAAIASGTSRLVAHDPGVRMGEDPEDVHQARVAVRRLRSDLRTFAPVLDEAVTEPLRDRLRGLGAALGEVRDAEVLSERLRRQAGELPGANPAAVTALLARLSTGREEARERLLVVLDSDDYLGVLDALVAAGASVPCRPEADVPAASGLAELVRMPWVRLRKAVEKLGDEPEVEALHEVRILAKHCRYAAEAAAPVIGKAARTFAHAVAEVQGVLGDLNDAVVAEAWLRAVGPSLDAPEVVLAGELVGLQRRCVDVGRRTWRQAWEEASAKSLRSWLR